MNQLMSIVIIFILIHLVITIFLYKLTYKKYKKDDKNIEKIKDPKYDTYKEIPREKATNPLQIGVLYYFNKRTQRTEAYNQIKKIFSAIILDFVSKEYLKVYYNNKNLKFILMIKPEEMSKVLIGIEYEIYKFLMNIAHFNGKKDSNTKEFSMDDLKNYIKSNSIQFSYDINQLIDVTEFNLKSQGIINEERLKYLEKYKEKKFAYTFWIFIFLAFLGIPEMIVCLKNYGICSKIIKKCRVENDEKAKLKALKKYIEEYSLRKEKDGLDIAVWEKYLICASVFGITNKILKNLKNNYPEIINYENKKYIFNYNFSEQLFIETENIYKYSIERKNMEMMKKSLGGK